jgi:hypothetical protein
MFQRPPSARCLARCGCQHLRPKHQHDKENVTSRINNTIYVVGQSYYTMTVPGCTNSYVTMDENTSDIIHLGWDTPATA